MDASFSVRVGEGANAAFINRAPGGKALESQMGGERVRGAVRNQMRRRPASRRDPLEASVAPAAVQDQTLNRGLGDERGAVHGHVHEPTPLTHYLQARQSRQQ